MDAILAAYASSASSASDASDSASDVEGDATTIVERTPSVGDTVGTKRKRQGEPPRPQWKRAFPHIDGQWPSHVSITITVDEQLRERVTSVIASAQGCVGDAVALVPLIEEPEDGGGDESPWAELHLSLSRPFTLTYDQIDAFVDALRTALKWRKHFQVSLGDVLVLVNDEKTRSFLALRVEQGGAAFLQTLKCVDRCMALFRLPIYYEDPIPHVSVASAVGGTLAQQLSPDRLVQLNSKELRPSWGMAVTKVQAVIGNKHFEIPLA